MSDKTKTSEQNRQEIQKLYDDIIEKLAELYGKLPDEISRALIYSALSVAALQKWHESATSKIEDDFLVNEGLDSPDKDKAN